jgi:hypothetical protein
MITKFTLSEKVIEEFLEDAKVINQRLLAVSKAASNAVNYSREVTARNDSGVVTIDFAKDDWDKLLSELEKSYGKTHGQLISE